MKILILLFVVLNYLLLADNVTELIESKQYTDRYEVKTILINDVLHHKFSLKGKSINSINNKFKIIYLLRNSNLLK